MVSDFLVSHKAPNMGHYQSGRNGGRGTEWRESQLLPKGLVQLSPGVGIAEGRRSCMLTFLPNTNLRPVLTEYS